MYPVCRQKSNQQTKRFKRYQACIFTEQTFVLALKARIIAAGMKFLGMEQFRGKPTKLKYPANTSKQDHNAKRKYI